MIDSVTLSIIDWSLVQLADEMDATLYRSAFNPIIAEARDACHGLYDALPVTRWCKVRPACRFLWVRWRLACGL